MLRGNEEKQEVDDDRLLNFGVLKDLNLWFREDLLEVMGRPNRLLF